MWKVFRKNGIYRDKEEKTMLFPFILKSATKPLNVLIAFTRPLITEFADNLREFGIRFMQTVAIALTPLYAQAVPLACSQRNNTQPMPSTGS